MLDIFSKYTLTVRKLIARKDSELALLFKDENLEEEQQQSGTGWPGVEDDRYLIRLSVPVELFSELKDKALRDEKENLIQECYKDVLRGKDGPWVESVAIVPAAEVEFSIQAPKNDAMWRPGYYRMFISHLSADKVRAAALKFALSKYGIDGFVAHEDIDVSKEWETEIESALYTMDALCAIVTPKFSESAWCDQEVGISLGQRKMVFSIDAGAVPYGFFGKYQALKSKSRKRKEVAYDLWKAVCANEVTAAPYRERFVLLILGANSEEDAARLLTLALDERFLSKRNVDFLYGRYAENNTLMSDTCLKIANKLFKENGLDPIKRAALSDQTLDSSVDLPF